MYDITRDSICRKSKMLWKGYSEDQDANNCISDFPVFSVAVAHLFGTESSPLPAWVVPTQFSQTGPTEEAISIFAPFV